MTNIVLDTNIWIYLTKDTFYELWIKLKEMSENDEINVLINDIILKEWDRNKETTISKLSKSIKNEFKSAQNLSNYLVGKAKSDYLNSISEYKVEKNRIEKAETRIQEIEIFMQSCQIIKVTDEQKLFISNLAIEKQPPFQNNKNNFNDALILRNICEFVENETPFKFDLIFVSKNPNDFTAKTTNDVYESLLEGLKPIRLKSVTQLGEALELAPELIEDINSWVDHHLTMEAQFKLDIIKGK